MRHHRQQLVARELLAVDDRFPGAVVRRAGSPRRRARCRGTAMRSVPSTVTSARDRSTTSVGRRMPKRDSVATRSSSTAGSTAPPGSDVLGHQPGERALELLGRRRVGEVGDALDAVAQQAHVAPGERHHDVDDRRLLDRVETADGAEVDQAERAVRQGEDVARVRDRRGTARCA